MYLSNQTILLARQMGAGALIALLALTTFACSGNNESNNNTAENNDTTSDMSVTMDMAGDAGEESDLGEQGDDGGEQGEDLGADMGTDQELPDDMGGDAMARLQVLHLADGAGTVDIYVNDEILIDDFEEKTGTGFFPVPAGASLKVDVVAGDAADNAEPVYTVTLAEGLAAESKTIVAAAGDVSSDDAATAFRLITIGGAKTLEQGASVVEALLIHAVDDAPAVDVVLEPNLPGQTVVEDVPFGAFTANATGAGEYLTIDPATLTFGGSALVDLNVADSDAFVTNFQTTDLNGLAGQKVVLAATGSLADGTLGLTAFLGLDAETPAAAPGLAIGNAARLQVVHNSPDPAAAIVDVYANGLKLIDDFTFRSATPFITVPANTGIDLNIAGPDSTDDSAPVVDGPEVRFEEGSTTAAIASGIVGGAGDAGFAILTTEALEKPGDDLNMFVKLHHGSPDSPAVGVRAAATATFLVESFEYGDFVDYLPIPLDTVTRVEITNPAANQLPVVMTEVEVPFSVNSPALVMASGSSGLLPDVFASEAQPAPIALIIVLPDGDVDTLTLVAPE